MIMKLFSLFALVVTTFTTSAYAHCEGSYAYSADSADPAGTCFLDIGFKKWGWSIGKLSIDTIADYSFPIYAGAAKCDLDKGNMVGQLGVSIYDCGNPTNCVNVEYTADAGYTFTEVNLYLGSEKVPKKNGKGTVSPGKYTITEDDVSTESYVHTFDDVMDDFYIIAHAETCD